MPFLKFSRHNRSSQDVLKKRRSLEDNNQLIEVNRKGVKKWLF